MCGKTEEWPDREGGKMFRSDKGCAHEGCINLYIVLKALQEIDKTGPNAELHSSECSEAERR